MADIALAGRVIASHYAEPLRRRLRCDTILLASENEADAIGTLAAGAAMRLLDISRGWAWGYAPDGRVGYVRADALER